MINYFNHVSLNGKKQMNFLKIKEIGKQYLTFDVTKIPLAINNLRLWRLIFFHIYMIFNSLLYSKVINNFKDIFYDLYHLVSKELNYYN